MLIEINVGGEAAKAESPPNRDELEEIAASGSPPPGPEIPWLMTVPPSPKIPKMHALTSANSANCAMQSLTQTA